MPLLSQPYRPFFLLAALFGAFSVLQWVVWLAGSGTPGPVGLNPLIWHGHEMVFGFAAAIIAGFLLTAVQNWTGIRAVGPWALLGLVLLWALARLGFTHPPWFPPVALAALDVAFLPLVAVALARPLLLTGNRRNLLFLPILLALALLNGLIHLDLLGIALGWGRPALLTAVLMVALLMVLMGGRVIPFFTGRRLPQAEVVQRPVLHWAAAGLALASTLAWLLIPHNPVTGLVLALTAIVLVLRLSDWRPLATRGEPLLWILHLGYLWLAVGYALLAASAFGLGVPATAGVHALMTGALGALGLGMIARVALGHTGRPLSVGPGMTAAFVLVNAAALTRVVTALGWGGSALLHTSAVLWAVAFALYLVHFLPILLRPRADAQPMAGDLRRG
ncbi:NnrS family protein [Alkalilimnicola ehrlichii MLHE-1]|uniref:NnrS family protein n=1 Tax=Alkalilimnicola ehrlichii (strain ATCC BAA-1101 / DSM 17681 / MLHE-1) TaxID=187272 RepID=Q0AC55_ALKEH|nr:NnrS family protein [Alkalilimnicola ehrlichii]ABI55582.1 NnrS family protein [Alkalilimnicola ehrlichii MLHE-1]